MDGDESVEKFPWVVFSLEPDEAPGFKRSGENSLSLPVLPRLFPSPEPPRCSIDRLRNRAVVAETELLRERTGGVFVPELGGE